MVMPPQLKQIIYYLCCCYYVEEDLYEEITPEI